MSTSKKLTFSYPTRTLNFFSDVVVIESYNNVSVQVVASNQLSEFSCSCTFQTSNDGKNWFDSGTDTIDINKKMVAFDSSTAFAFSRIRVEISKGSADFDIYWCLKE